MRAKSIVSKYLLISLLCHLPIILICASYFFWQLLNHTYEPEYINIKLIDFKPIEDILPGEKSSSGTYKYEYILSHSFQKILPALKNYIKNKQHLYILLNIDSHGNLIDLDIDGKFPNKPKIISLIKTLAPFPPPPISDTASNINKYLIPVLIK